MTETPNCTGKQPFDTYEAAQLGIRPRMGNSVRPYRCETCGQWHIGNHTRSRYRAPKGRRK